MPTHKAYRGMSRPVKNSIEKHESNKAFKAIINFKGFQKPPFFKYHCPCCGKKSNDFIEFPHYFPSELKANTNAMKSKKTTCPHCFSLPRHRLECIFLDEIDLSAMENVLIFAPEYCIVIYFENRKCLFKTADLFNKDADFCFDIQDIPLPDNSQDLIICNHVFEHVVDDLKAISELSRILKKTGTALITVPADLDKPFTDEDIRLYNESGADSFGERVRRFGQYDHLRLYGKDFKERLATAFDVDILDGNKLEEKYLTVCGPSDIDVNVLYICTKKNSM